MRNRPTDLGLRISQYQDIGILGVLGLILQSASTLHEVIKYSSDYCFYMALLYVYISMIVLAQMHLNPARIL